MKNHDLENYVKEEATAPKGDEDNGTRRIYSNPIGLFPPPLDLTCIILVDS